MMNNKPLIILLLMSGLFVLLLSGCGFHLKGSEMTLQMKAMIAMKPKVISIDYGSVSAVFRQELQQLLLGNKSIRLGEKEEASIYVLFHAESCKRRSLSVSRTGVPAEYQLSCKLSFEIQKNAAFAKGAVDTTTNTTAHEIIERRDFQSNNSQLLAFDSQQNRIKQQILHSIAQRFIRQMQASH